MVLYGRKVSMARKCSYRKESSLTNICAAFVEFRLSIWVKLSSRDITRQHNNKGICYCYVFVMIFVISTGIWKASNFSECTNCLKCSKWTWVKFSSRYITRQQRIDILAFEQSTILFKVFKLFNCMKINCSIIWSFEYTSESLKTKTNGRSFNDYLFMLKNVEYLHVW